MTAWWIGSASKNSLASTSSGPSGTSSIDRCHETGTALPDKALRWSCSSAGLISTRWSAMAAWKSGITLAARNASSIMVPRPGPSSTRRILGGESIARQAAAAHRPISSPNIWLISGAVVKSPRAPSGSRVV